MSLAVIGTVAAVAGVGMSAYSMSQAGGSAGGGMVQETAQGRKAADIAAEQYNTYLSEVKPTEEKFIADVMKPTDLQEAAARGKVNADVQQRLSTVTKGMAPSSIMKNSAGASEVAKGMAAFQIKANLGVQEKKVAGMQAITDIGEGKRSTAQLGMNSVAADAQKQAITSAQLNEDRNGATLKGASGLVGAVGSLVKNWPTSGMAPNAPTDYSLGYESPTYQASFSGMAPSAPVQPVQIFEPTGIYQGMTPVI